MQPIFSRYLLNIGTPFEVWLKHLTETSQQESNPSVFLTRAIEHFTALPWVSGLAWVSNAGHGNVGVSSRHRIEATDHDLHLTLFSHQQISPATALHIHLLVQLLGHFYQSKRHEQRLREFARLQAIYETGSRLTHDLKNMLQSLLTLTAVAQHHPDKAQPVLQRQLPILTQRIELILSKLKSPEQEADTTLQPLPTWWQGLQQRHQYEGLEWVEASQLSTTNPTLPLLLQDGGMGNIPSALFDCVADNLIDNACNKRLREPDIQITVTLRSAPFSLSVTATGLAILPSVARLLLSTVVPSEDGLGVGLYQAARWASQMGFRIALAENKPKQVRFELREATRA